MNGFAQVGFDRATLIDRIADDVHDTTQRGGTNGNGDRLTKIGDGLSPDQTLGGVHGNGADGVFAKVLGDFEDQAITLIVGFQSVQNVRKVAVEFHVDNSADDLADTPGLFCSAHARRLLWRGCFS